MDSYKHCLKIFKESLIGGSEKEIVFQKILKQAPSNRLRWLDLGIGSGNFSKKIIGRLLRKGFKIELTGVDKDKESIKSAKKNFKNLKDYKFIETDFEHLSLKDKFDIIYFSQSLYYLKNKKHFLKKILNHLSEGGLIIVVLWSEKDSIYKLNKKFFRCHNKNPTYNIEMAHKLFKSFMELQKIQITYFAGKVDFGKWLQNKNLEMIYSVISRINFEDKKEEIDIKAIREYLRKKKYPVESRINGILIAKKKYEIPNFNRKNIVRLLEKRFPSYKEKIKKLKGDLEALFMASWEKETDYLSKQIKRGKVLETCCGVGCKSIILAKKHEVVAIDINKNRIASAKKNARLFNFSNKIKFVVGDASKVNFLSSLGRFSAIYVDADWREDLKHPIKQQNINPFKTTPRTDLFYKTLRKLFPNALIVFKVSPFSRVKDMQKLGRCKIEELYINGKFLSYNVYYSPKIRRNEYVEVNL